MVSVCVLSYNHEKYLRDCLEGIVMQRTTFPIEAWVHDDASTDSSQEIIKEYQQRYPEIIKPILQTENQYSKKEGSILQNHVYPHCAGKYIALCEGDDYWIDPLKLQKQVDYLESHPQKDLCCTASRRYVQVGKTFENIDGSILCENYETCIQGSNDIYTATVLVRQGALQNCVSELAMILPPDLMFDTAYWYWFSYHQKVKFLDEPMAVYRILENSASHTTDSKVQSYMLWRFLRLKLYFLIHYPLRKNQNGVIQCIISEIEQYAEWERYCGQQEVRNSKKYKLGAKLLNPIIKISK